jgi:hypothetical protein
MRKINNKLIARLIEGDLKSLLDYIKVDKELRLEVRQNGEAFVYYRKGKALEIGKLKVDGRYGDVPLTDIAVSNPQVYFEQIKQTIDNWLYIKKARAEFDSQQKIAFFNQDKNDRYIILDMEYQFEQNQISKEKREKTAIFDLLGIERETGRIIFFELKKGMGAIRGKSGIDDHIKDFDTYINGKNKDVFMGNLLQDIKNVISDKTELGILSDFDKPNNLGEATPELIFIFHPDNPSEIKDFEKELNKRCKLVCVSDIDYKLR